MITLSMNIQTLQLENGRYSPIIEYMQNGRSLTVLTFPAEYDTIDEAYQQAYRFLRLERHADKIRNNIKRG